MMTFNGKEISYEEFLRLKENMIVYDNAILEYNETTRRLKATVFENDERTQKILEYYGLK